MVWDWPGQSRPYPNLSLSASPVGAADLLGPAPAILLMQIPVTSIGVVAMARGNKFPYSKLHGSHFVPCTGYGTGQLVCLF